jgi:structural maintenance of chromosomes flexible hinge domain-containing protein 1
MESERHDISFVPNYRTLVSAGHSHFSRVADAFAEFVDNSIQATQGKQATDARIINLGLDINFHGDAHSYLSILDNGEGMSRQTLADFAVYSLDKESRGLDPSNENASNISKFGVGAKQAGFYLGTRIHVLTSASGSSKILELILDKDTIEKRFHNNEDVYSGHISSHDAEASSSSSGADFQTEGKYNPRLQKVANSLFEQTRQQPASSFTLITVQLRKTIRRELHRDESFKSLPTQMADIYHFHLHPDHLPNPIATRTFEE